MGHVTQVAIIVIVVLVAFMTKYPSIENLKTINRTRILAIVTVAMWQTVIHLDFGVNLLIELGVCAQFVCSRYVILN